MDCVIFIILFGWWRGMFMWWGWRLGRMCHWLDHSQEQVKPWGHVVFLDVGGVGSLSPLEVTSQCLYGEHPGCFIVTLIQLVMWPSFLALCFVSISQSHCWLVRSGAILREVMLHYFLTTMYKSRATPTKYSPSHLHALCTGLWIHALWIGHFFFLIF